MRISQTVAALGMFAMTSGIAFSQHYGGAGVAARAPLPSSTAIGSGALSHAPSSTSRSSAPAFGFTRPYGGNYGGYYNSRNSNYRNYRTLPRSYVIAPYYYPSFDWTGGTDNSAAGAPPYDPAYDQGYGPDPATDALLRSQAALGAQVQRLTDQMNGMMYGQGYPQAPAAAEQQTPQTPPITVVLRNGEHLQVQNYAISADTFWDFTQHGTRKIPTSTIDVPASRKATEAVGGEFPSLGNGQ